MTFITVYFIISLLFLASTVKYIEGSPVPNYERFIWIVLILAFSPIYLLMCAIEQVFAKLKP